MLFYFLAPRVEIYTLGKYVLCHCNFLMLRDHARTIGNDSLMCRSTGEYLVSNSLVSGRS